MELRHLKYFLAVAEELHFGRAAARIHIAQPPLSKQIKQLEEELGFKLFNRTKRKVELTEAGKVFQQEVNAVLARLEKGILKTKKAVQGQAGSLNIGFLGSMNHEFLPKVLREFRRQYPGVETSLQDVKFTDQNQFLIENKIHIGFSRSGFESTEVVSRVIAYEPLMVAVSASHQLAKKEFLTLSDLKNVPYIMVSPIQAPAVYDHFMRLFKDAGFQPRTVQEVESLETALGLIAADIGVALVPQSIKSLQREGAVYRPLQSPNSTVEILMHYRRNENSPIFKNLVKVIKKLYPMPQNSI